MVQKPFPRPLPRTLDPNIISDYGDSFRLLQEIAATGDNLFTDVSPEYVLSIKNAFVEGEGGLVYDAARNVYHLPHFFHNRTSIVVPMPLHSVQDVRHMLLRFYVFKAYFKPGLGLALHHIWPMEVSKQ